MEKLWEKIYDEIISLEPDSVDSKRAIDSKALNYIQSYKDSLDEVQLQGLQDQFFDISFFAQRQGFRLGVKYTCDLLAGIFDK